MERNKIWQELTQNPQVTVLIIGAGINGMATFWDLALQGVDALIVDRGDFCSGASSASSHMVHGGIRYLENGEFRLVREAVGERNRLLQNAPQYVKPLATNVPIFRPFSGLLNAPLKFLGLMDRPAERGAVVIKAGLMMYDAYTGKHRTVPRHDFIGKREALAKYPKLNRNILSLATYYDAAMPSPERICVELMLDAERELPTARALNYVSAIAADDKTITLRDELTGEKVAVTPHIVVNAAGPWIDYANDALGQETHFIGGTKGSHLVLDHPELHAAIDGHEFFFENDDGRIVLIYPLLDKVMVGTSDIPIDDPDEARCTEEEVDYFFALVKRVFPTINVDRSHIVFRFSGVRPLPASKAASAGQISRDHSIELLEAGENGRFYPIYNLIGGKWTTFRAFAEQAADQVLHHLGHRRQQSTKPVAIGGGRDYPRTAAEQAQWLTVWHDKTGVSKTRLRQLFDRYGTRAAEIATFITQGDDAPLTHHPGYSQREIIFLAQTEKVVHLDDLILRRSLLGMLGEVTAGLVGELTAVVAPTLHWNPTRQQAEIARTRSLLAERHGVILEE
ncbi:MAG: glycerol-3-phosphate dehydrogenase/oxidase [Anaerolineales bacterium]|nr:glycerol-3-phosphate dehydrogenase/oxidase [Anaerolineales bacterium]